MRALISNRRCLFLGTFVLAISLVTTVPTAEAQTNEPDVEFTKALSTAFKDASAPVKRRIISTLKDVGEPAVPILTDALNDPSADVRRDAAVVLGDIGKPAQSAKRQPER